MQICLDKRVLWLRGFGEISLKEGELSLASSGHEGGSMELVKKMIESRGILESRLLESSRRLVGGMALIPHEGTSRWHGREWKGKV